MSILKIARMGHPVLRTVAAPVADPTSPEIARLAADMAETMADAGGVGLAAPQVHVSLRLILFMVPEQRLTGIEGDVTAGVTALANPVIEPLSDEMNLGWEGCLSIPGLRGAVPRWTRIRYRGTLLDGTEIEREAAGFNARVVQHECDHLDGIMYFERMTDHRLLGFYEEAARYPIDLAAYEAGGKP